MNGKNAEFCNTVFFESGLFLMEEKTILEMRGKKT